MTAQWRVAYDHQVDLWSWWHTPAAQTMAAGYMRSVSNTGHGDPLAVDALVEGQRRIMLHGDPVVIDDDMMALVEHAAKEFPPEPLRAEDILTPTAFVWLPHPFRIFDVNEKYMTVRAIAWGPVAYRVKAASGDEPAVMRDGLMLTYYSWSGDADVDDYGPDMASYRAAYNIELSLAHWEPWLFGESYEPHDAPGADRDTLRFIQTMWRLMQQTISAVGKQRPERGTRRRAAKVGMPEKYVTVITLRRPKKEPEDAEPRTVEWSHRWVTSGHWRNQWFPSLGSSADAAAHRVIWISPYIKGPADKPLEIRRLRAFEWVQ